MLLNGPMGVYAYKQWNSLNWYHNIMSLWLIKIALSYPKTMIKLWVGKDDPLPKLDDPYPS